MSGNEESNTEDLSQGVLFLIVLMFGGGTIFLTNMHRIPLPFTVVMFLYGIFVGAVANLVYPDVCKVLGSFPTDLLFFIFLPVLIFEGSYGMNIYAFRTVGWQVVIMATVGIVINTALLAVPIAWLVPHWSWYSAFLLGSLLSATDPVAVVSLLKGLGVDKRITAMVDGEALMNDGTAIIAFNLLLPAARVGSFESSFWSILLKSLQLSGLPLIVGPFFGFVQLFWLGRAPSGLCQACITVSVTYISYYVADHLIGTSGVLTLLFEGLFLSAYCPTLFPGREGNLIHEIWDFLVHLGNTVLFSLVGVILVADVWPTLGSRDVLVILCLYIAMLLARLVMLEVLLPVLNLFSFKISQREVLLLVHAGLRGGVSATLALAVLQDGLSIGTEVVKYTCGAVLLTLLVNATTAGVVVEALGHKKKEKNMLVEMKFGMEYLRDVGKRETQRIRSNAGYQQAQWVKVENYISANFESPYKSMACEEEAEHVVANKLLMRVLKARMWALRDRVVISETVTITLASALSHCISRGELLTVERIFGNACADETQEYLITPRAGGTGENGNDADQHTAVTVASNDGDEFAVSTTPVHPLESMMLPLWVKLTERLIRPNFWVEQHKRAQQNAFVVLLAYIKCLEEVEEIKFQYTVNEEHARVIEEWITSEHMKVKSLIRKCQKMYPTAVADVASIDLAEAVLDSMVAGVHDLNSHHGFGRHAMHFLEETLFQMRKNIPRYWGRAPRAERLYRDALSASHLSRGLSREEILSIMSLALRRQYKEGDVIDASDAFHVIVFGLVEPQRHRLSAPEEVETVGFGSVIAIDSMVTPKSALKRWPKRWIVRSSECKTLLMPFSTVQPFLLERSLRAVHSFWRTVAAEALIDDLKDIVTLPPNAQGRRHMEEIILQGQPVIGHVECAKYDWSRNSSLCFYLRGNDSSGLFRTNITPPTYISAFFANTLKWEDPSVVLYAVPVRISEDGYTPWRFTTEEKTDGNEDQPANDRSPGVSYDGTSEHSRTDNDSNTVSPTLPRQLPSISSLTGLDESVCTYSNAAELLCAVMTGKVRQVREDGLGGGGSKMETVSNNSTPQRVSHADGPPPSSPWTATSFGTGSGKAALQRYPSLGYIEEADYPRLRPVTSDWSDWTFVLQHPEDFVTCVPYVNTLMLRYANVLEQLCLAALRFWRFPKDRINRRHAIHVADVTLGFMMSLCTDLFLIRRAIRCIQLYGGNRPPATPLSKVLPPGRRGSAQAPKAPPQQREAVRVQAGEDDELPAETIPSTGPASPAADGPPSLTSPTGSPAEATTPAIEKARELETILAYEKESGEEASFACCVAHIARTAGESRCFELKVMIMAMRDLAEKRLRRLRTSLDRAKKTHPEICKVESADELEKISKACFQ